MRRARDRLEFRIRRRNDRQTLVPGQAEALGHRGPCFDAVEHGRVADRAEEPGEVEDDFVGMGYDT